MALFLFGIVLGALVGFIVACLLAAGSNSDDLQDAYNLGFKDGKNATLDDVNNLYNKYKDMADGHNNDRH